MAEKRPLSLDGLIQTKGAARPDVLAQRGDGPARTLQAGLQATMSPTTPPVPAPAAREPRAKSLTLRLSERQYERLRRFAFEHRLSHQDIIERALVEHLDRNENGT